MLQKALRGLAVLLVLACATVTARAEQYLIASDSLRVAQRVDLQSGAVIGPMWFSGAEIDFADGKVYASFSALSLVRQIDLEGGGDVNINLPGKPRDVTIGPDGQLYVAVIGDGLGGGTRGIYRYNVSTGQLSAFSTFPLGGLPTGIAFSPTGDLFVCLIGTSQDSVVRIDGQTGSFKSLVTTLNLSRPQSIAFGPSGEFFVANQGTHSIGRFQASGLDVGSISYNAENPQGLYFLPDGDLVWGTGGSTFQRYDFSTNIQTTFSSGYVFSMGMVLVPEPTGLMVLGIMLSCVMRVRGNRSRRIGWLSDRCGRGQLGRGFS
jgi:hypothetical protein